MFGEKIVCDQCNKKVKKKASLYRRGSRFCTQTCVDDFERANPPPIARGEPAALRGELVMVLDEAFTEARRRFGATFGLEFVVGDARVELSIPNRMDEAHRAEMLATAFQLFQSHTLRAAPILRALGFTREAALIDSHDFLEQPSEPLIRELVAVRKQF